jgi:phosphatidylinositol dimannoside acyltransferase
MVRGVSFSNFALRVGLALADLIASRLPARAAYALADLAGEIWFRAAPARRALVAENLRRVCAATGRPTRGAAFRKLVRQAFIEHARYYLELVRAPHYPLDRIEEKVTTLEWDRWDPILRAGAVAATAHLGNFEPYGSVIVRRGIKAMAPVERIEPRALFDFLRARRGGGRGIALVPLDEARRPMTEALKRREVVGLVADRDLAGSGIKVPFFGRLATMPSGPAQLAISSGLPLLAAACLRTGPDTFEARAWPVEVERTGNRRTDVAALTLALTRRLEDAIALAPEQWFGSFQPIWLDQLPGGRRRRARRRPRTRPSTPSTSDAGEPAQ